MVREVGVVAGEHEDGVLEPGLFAGRLEELADGHIRITDAFVDHDALFRKSLFVLFRHHVGMMAAGGEDGRHERLLHL